MSRQFNIKWRVKDERELAQVARDFNRKLERLVENNPKNASALPKFYNTSTDKLEPYIAVENIKSLITSRADYNRIVNMLKRFMREGAEEVIDAPENEYGTRVTKWQAQEMKRLASAVNRGKAKRLAEVEKLKAWKRLKDMGFKIAGIRYRDNKNYIEWSISQKVRGDHFMSEAFNDALHLLFGGKYD